jgi:maltooligosyltrehalose trehalohydrolase
VGNRVAGDRLPEIASPGMLRVGAVLLLTSPFTPMLWMGEEWAASTRWPFFTSHPEPELAEATGKGRIAEFAEHGWDVSQMIDPQDEDAYRSAILDWDEVRQGSHADMLALYKHLIALRAAEPELTDADLRHVRVDIDEDERWLVMHRGALRVIANLSTQERTVAVDAYDLVLATGSLEVGAGQVVIGPESAAVVRAR